MFEKMIAILLCFIIQVIAIESSKTILTEISDKQTPEDGRLNFTELARKYGFNAEQIEVETEDGYLLTMFHIPGKKKPVLMVHGIGDTSNTWIIRGHKSLAVELANKGYDVWCGNIRGNKYGRKHIKLNPDKDEKFWDYSYHEVGLYDWRAMIDRVLKETNETKLNAIGHSQGETSLMVLLSTKPEYNNKVNLNIGLAPVAFLDQVGPALTLIIKAAPLIIEFLNLLGINELFADHSAEKEIVQLLCDQGFVRDILCGDGLLSLLSGDDKDGIEPEFLSVIFGQYPAGVSKKTLVHFYQLAVSGQFAEYDYGVAKNMLLYESLSPPEYNLSQVTAKMALLYGENDLAASPVNVRRLATSLPNVVYLKAIEKKKWAHVDFIWSSEMDRYLFGHVTELLKKYDW